MKTVQRILIMFVFLVSCQMSFSQENENLMNDTFIKVDTGFIYINNGLRKGKADNEYSQEKKFTLFLPKKKFHLKSSYGGVAFYLFRFDKNKIILIVNNSELNKPVSKFSLSLTEFNSIKYQYKFLPSIIAENKIKLRSSCKFGICSFGEFVICYLNVKLIDETEFIKSIQSLKY